MELGNSKTTNQLAASCASISTLDLESHGKIIIIGKSMDEVVDQQIP